jgi:choloylglycine hydrolase
MKRLLSFGSIIALSLCLVMPGFTCSTFCLEHNGKVVVGRNLDWLMGGGMIIVNKHDVNKFALPLNPETQLSSIAKWTSKYGSVSFNMLAREFPCGGINEKGLVVNEMTLSKSIYPAEDSRKGLSPLQWIQYMLDTCATVEEVISANKTIRIYQEVPSRHHFLVADKTGKTATFDFVDGKMQVHTGKTLPAACLTNNTYNESAGYLKQHKGFGGERSIEKNRGSLNRFVTAADLLKQYDGKEKQADYAFNILQEVSQGKATVWSVVFDIQNNKISYRTSAKKNIRSIDLTEMDYSSATPTLVQNVDNGFSGDVTNKFVPYTQEFNRKTVEHVLNNERFKSSYADLTQLIEPLATYPDQFTIK